MPEPPNLEKAELREISWTGSPPQVRDGDPAKTVKVQFNPETLTVSFTNQNQGGDQRGGSAVQFVGKGNTKLALDLWFDATAPLPEGAEDPQGDVRNLTKRVAEFMKPAPAQGQRDKWVPPGVRFLWGTFLFDGVMESLTEKLEYFSADGKPVRASLQVALKSQEIQFQFGPGRGAAGGLPGGGLPGGGPAGDSGAPQAAPGTQPQQVARQGDSLQQLAAAAGQSDWKPIAAANGIENPRLLTPGVAINLNPKSVQIKVG